MSEEYKSAYATDVKKLRFKGLLDRAFYGKTKEEIEEVMQMIYNGEIVFNRAFFELWVENEIELEAVGTKEDRLLRDVIDPVSRKRYVDGTIVEAEYEGADYVIPPNTSDEALEGTYTIKQKHSNLEVSGKWTQKADSVVSVEFLYVDNVNVKYDGDASASGAYLYHRIEVYYTVKETMASGTSKTKTYSTNGDVTYAYGQDQNNSGATIGNDGVIDPPYLGKTSTPYQGIFVINEMRGTVRVRLNDEYIDEEWTWTGSHFIYQEANVLYNNGASYYDINTSISKSSIGGEESTVTVSVSAWRIQPKVWSSGATDSEYTSTWVNLTPSLGSLGNSTLYGDSYTTWTIPQNGTSQRTLTLDARNDPSGYSETFSVTQEAYIEVEYWEAPNLNGSVYIAEIPANGSGVPVQVPITQNKRKGSTIVETYTATVNAVAVTGSAIPNTGASFSGGLMSASSMGTVEYQNGRVVFYIATVSVIGKDGVEYRLTGLGTPEVRQAKNVKSTQYGAYVLSVSANPSSGISALGGTSTITASAQLTEIYTWSSGADGGNKLVDTNANLRAVGGTVSPTSITGTNKTSTLTIGENSNKTENPVTVYLEQGGTSTSTVVWQSAASYEFYSNTLATSIGVGGGDISLTVVSRKNGNALDISASNVSVSGISGTTKSVTSLGFGEYNVTVNVPQNTSGSERNLTIAVSHPTGKESNLTWNITQAAEAAVGLPKAVFLGSFSFGILIGGGNNFSSVFLSTFTMSASPSSSYLGGTLSGVTFKLIGRNTGVMYDDYYVGDIYVERGGSTSVSKPVSLDNSVLGTKDVYVEIWWDGAKQQTADIMYQAEEQ